MADQRDGRIGRRGVRRRGSAASGQATAEFSLVIVVVLVLFLAIVDFGHIVAMHAGVVTASREAARYGSAVGDAQNTDSPTVPPPNTPRYVYCDGIRHAARKVVGGLLTLPDNRITITYDDAAQPSPAQVSTCPTGTTAANPADIDPLHRIVVSVEIRYAPVSPLRVFGEVSVVSTNRRTIVKSP